MQGINLADVSLAAQMLSWGRGEGLTDTQITSINADNPPTFHEIRSLGGALLKEAGWTNEQIQALMGHSNVAMTEHYLGGHEAPWQAVSTGIALPR